MVAAWPASSRPQVRDQGQRRVREWSVAGVPRGARHGAWRLGGVQPAQPCARRMQALHACGRSFIRCVSIRPWMSSSDHSVPAVFLMPMSRSSHVGLDESEVTGAQYLGVDPQVQARDHRHAGEPVVRLPLRVPPECGRNPRGHQVTARRTPRNIAGLALGMEFWPFATTTLARHGAQLANTRTAADWRPIAIVGRFKDVLPSATWDGSADSRLGDLRGGVVGPSSPSRVGGASSPKTLARECC